MEQGHSLIYGVCLPLATKDTNADLNRVFKMLNTLSFASSLDELRQDDQFNIFFDTDKAVVYARFSENRQRADEDLGDCIGGLGFGTCPHLKVFLSRFKVNLDANDGDCRARFP